MTNIHVVVKGDLDYNVFYNKEKDGKKEISVLPVPLDFESFVHDDETAQGYAPSFVKQMYIHPETKEIKEHITLKEFLKETFTEEEGEYPMLIPLSTSYHITSHEQVPSQDQHYTYDIYRGTMKVKLMTQELPLDVLQAVKDVMAREYALGRDFLFLRREDISISFAPSLFIKKVYLSNYDKNEQMNPGDIHALSQYNFYLGHNTMQYTAEIVQATNGLHKMVVEFTFPEATFGLMSTELLTSIKLLSTQASVVNNFEVNKYLHILPRKVYNKETSSLGPLQVYTFEQNKAYRYYHVDEEATPNKLGVNNVHKHYKFYSNELPRYDNLTVNVERTLTSDPGVL